MGKQEQGDGRGVGLEMRTRKYVCKCHLKAFLLSGNLKSKNFKRTCVKPNPRSIPLCYYL